MLSIIATGLGVLLKACGLIDWGEKMFELAEAREQGVTRQKLSDDEATISTVDAARKAENAAEHPSTPAEQSWAQRVRDKYRRTDNS